MIRLLISTGEVSGDLQGSLLIKALREKAAKRDIDIEIFALGGDRMKSEGANLIANTASMGAIGLLEALPYVLPTLRVQSKVDDFIKTNAIDAVILIDYMGPNIRLGNKLKKVKPELPIIYYIAPQEWAWRLGEGGTTDLIGFTDKILAIFKAEADFYSQKGGNVIWVGHPMLDNFSSLPSQEESFEKLGLDTSQKVLLLLPASRSQEIRYLMPTLAKAAAKLQQKYDNLFTIVPSGLHSFDIPLKSILDENGVNGMVIAAKDVTDYQAYIFSVASLALCKSGTVNMELALNRIPQIVGYKLNRITAFIARKILRFHVDHISPVNLLLNERLVPELLQDEFTSDSLVDLAIPLLEDTEERKIMLRGYDKFREYLGDPGVTNRAANEILSTIIEK